MKTIQIPTYNSPFTVVINNNVYRYNAGETTEVPDEVAEAIENALELVPKPERYLSKLAQRAEGSLVIITAEDLEGITAIAGYAFQDLKSLQDATIPDSVTAIGDSAFFGCADLRNIRFGVHSKLDSIGSNAFEWCGRLTSVCLPGTPPSLANINAFANIKPACTFHCKTQTSLDAYKAAENWSTLTGTYSFVVDE